MRAFSIFGGMAGNTFGTLFRLTTFGESHGEAVGGIIDGCPAGLEMDMAFIQQQLNRRRPGQSRITTRRNESDEVQFLSGIFENKTLGTPIGFLVANSDHKSSDYSHLKETFRPSHADFTYAEKYGHRDYRGGGRSSARETVCRVVAGAVAQILLHRFGVTIQAWVHAVGDLVLKGSYENYNLLQAEENDVRCPDPNLAGEMVALISKTKKAGDTLGGVVSCVARSVPAGLGEPVFDKLNADLAKAMCSINAVKGFELGSGFAGTRMKGSEHNDIFTSKNERIGTKTNNSGGIQGGISNGEDIFFKVAFKPVATILRPQPSLDSDGNETVVEGRGRHDPCVVPRAVPIVEAMAALVLADHLLRNRTSKL